MVCCVPTIAARAGNIVQSDWFLEQAEFSGVARVERIEPDENNMQFA